jgi:hypothetical protein
MEGRMKASRRSGSARGSVVVFEGAARPPSSLAVGLSVVALFGLLTGTPARAADIPLRNWSPPGHAGGITIQSDITLPIPFIGLQPCRLVDTRGNGAPFTGGKFAAGESRDYVLAGVCDIPVTAKAVSLNVTVTDTDGAGFLSAYPNGTTFPGTATLNYAASGVTIANAAIVPLGSPVAGPGITVTAGVSGTHVIIDTNGYFSGQPASGLPLAVVANNSGWAITGTNFYNDNRAIGVGGYAINATADSAGVFGRIGLAFPVLGCCGPAGVRGESPHVGVLGLGKDLGAAGRIYDDAGNTLAGGDLGVRVSATITYGVQGVSLTNAVGSAGVKGVDHSGEPNPGSVCCGIAGVRGVSLSHTGVDGVSRDGVGVVGWNKDGAGSTLAWGALGASDTLGIAFVNGIAGTGTKSFVEPHPTDASKAIRYVSLEGNEAGTYFRGRAKFERGLARIPVPEDFRLVTDPEGLTVQITPIGEMASVAVVRVGLDEIVVKSSRNVEFFYAVNGVRHAYRDWEPVVSSRDFFMPESQDQTLPAYFNPEERRRLIANGTYNADGTVNVQTAERVGWTRIWRERRETEDAAVARARATNPLEGSGTAP